MARTRTYNENARERIRNAVEGWERRRTRQQPNRPMRHNQSRHLIACIADEDISHNAFGLVSIAEAASFDSVYLPTQQIVAYNAQADITSGTKVLVDTASLRGADEVAGIQYVIVTVYDAQGSDGGSGDIILEADDFSSASFYDNDCTLHTSPSLQLVTFNGVTETHLGIPRFPSRVGRYWESLDICPNDAGVDGNLRVLEAGDYLVFFRAEFAIVQTSGASPDTGSIKASTYWTDASAAAPGNRIEATSHYFDFTTATTTDIAIAHSGNFRLENMVENQERHFTVEVDNADDKIALECNLLSVNFLRITIN